MSDENEEKQVSTGDRIITVRIKKDGKRVKKFVYFNDDIQIPLSKWEVERLRENLKENNRVIFYDPETEEQICRFYNMLTPEGKLRPTCQIGAEFADNIYKCADAPKVVLKHRGQKVGKETLARLNRETRAYRNNWMAAQRAVPFRTVIGECPKCGTRFPVHIKGYGSED